jgi:Protein of unknown function (DUF4031)
MFDELVIFDTPMLHEDGKRWSHLVARDTQLLHDFAINKLGFDPEWFQNKPGFPHYDIKTHKKRQLAKSFGAVQVERKYLHIYSQVRHKMQNFYGTHPELKGFFGLALAFRQPTCDLCHCLCFINHQYDTWCSNPACEYHISDFKPYFDQMKEILLRPGRSANSGQ